MLRLRLLPTVWRRSTLVLAVGAALALAVEGCAPSPARTSIASALPTQVGQTIAITTDRASYQPSEVIGVTVQNVTGAPLFAIEQYSACTMLQLQFKGKSGWETAQPCNGGPPPQVRQLAPKIAFPLSFGPGNAPDNPNLWRTGIYRFALAYGTKADGSNATSYGYSAGFSVAS
jgi:hypothetical protein